MTTQQVQESRGSSRTVKVLALSLGRSLSALVRLVALAVLARVLSKAEYATFQQTFLAYAFIMPFLSLGMPQALYYFLPTEKERVRGRVVDNLILLTAMGCLLAIFLALGGNHLLAMRFNNPALGETLLYLIPYVLFAFPMLGLDSVMVARERVFLLSIYNVVTRLGVGIAVIGACLLWRNAEAPIVAEVTATGLAALFGLMLIVRSTPGDGGRPSWHSMREMFIYSLPLGFASVFGILTKQFDKIIVSIMRSPEEFAVYSVGAIEIPLISIVTGSILSVVLPDLRKAAANKDFDGVMRLFRLAAEKSALLLFPTMTFLLACGDAFIQTLFSAEYAESVIPFRIYLLLLPIRTVVFGAMLIALGKSNLVLIQSAIGLIVNITLSVFSVYFFGAWGASLATVISIYIWAVPFYMFAIGRLTGCSLSEILPIRVLARTLIQASLPALLVAAIEWRLRAHAPLTRLFVEGTIFAAWAVYWWHGKLYTWQGLKVKLAECYKVK